ncbi:MAG TPA: hypothetical protein DCF68_07455 [Cyanothece sp. UBA12306]|nr:hypothetical protein [Cyanothece sp. UBA12306]
MKIQHQCPLCGSLLLPHVRGGKLGWFCRHCDQEIPYSLDQHQRGTEVINHHNEYNIENISQKNPLIADNQQLNQYLTSDQSNNFLSPPLVNPFTVRDILNTLVKGIIQFLQTDRVIVAQIMPSGEITVIEESRNKQWKTMLHLRLGQFLSFQDMQTWQKGEIQTINDIQQQGYRESSMTTLDNLFEVKAKIVVPILQNRASLTVKEPRWQNQNYQPHQTLPKQLWGLLIVHQCSSSRQWTDSEIGLLSLLASQIAISIQQDNFYQHVNNINQKLEQIAFLDRLTQIANRYYFDQYLNQEWRRMAREKQSISLILCDVDFFKSYNDTYGHPAGDICLQKVAQAIKSSIGRPGDLLARYGGEEFVIILPNTKAEGASYVAEKIRFKVKSLGIISARQDVSKFITISLGVASFIPDETLSPAMLVAEADRALYQAKKNGRDRVIASFEQPGINSPISPIIIQSSLIESQPIDTISNIELLRSYVAYFVSRGIKIASPLQGELSFDGLVYQYHGYHQEFLNFWRQFEQRSDYKQLHLQGDSHSFGQFLEGDFNVNECARCSLPIVNPVGNIYDVPDCTMCLEDSISGKWCKLNKPISNNNQNEIIKILVISPQMEKVRIIQQWLSKNGIESIFFNDPTEVNSLLFLEEITSIIIDAGIAENDVKNWAKQLCQHCQLKEVPIIALSSEAGQGIPWVNRKLGLEDYLTTPLNGQKLALYLRYLTKSHSSINSSNVYWFPR